MGRAVEGVVETEKGRYKDRQTDSNKISMYSLIILVYYSVALLDLNIFPILLTFSLKKTSVCICYLKSLISPSIGKVILLNFVCVFAGVTMIRSVGEGQRSNNYVSKSC